MPRLATIFELSAASLVLMVLEVLDIGVMVGSVCGE